MRVYLVIVNYWEEKRKNYNVTVFDSLDKALKYAKKKRNEFFIAFDVDEFINKDGEYHSVDYTYKDDPVCERFENAWDQGYKIQVKIKEVK